MSQCRGMPGQGGEKGWTGGCGSKLIEAGGGLIGQGGSGGESKEGNNI